jgi:hypothetical protein
MYVEHNDPRIEYVHVLFVCSVLRFAVLEESPNMPTRMDRGGAGRRSRIP